MVRSTVFVLFVATELIACATISGLSDKEAVDCPGGCEEAPPRPSSSGGSSGSGASDSGAVDTGPAKCDPSSDPQCMPLPSGWSLVARAPLAGGNPPACPSGMTKASTIDEAPTAMANACACDTCSVTAQATCSGQLTYTFGTGTVCNQNGDPGDYTNLVAGNCYTDTFHSVWAAAVNRFVLPMPMGGACTAGPPVVHADRVTYGARAELCDDTGRCSGGVCDARIDAPFATCVAHDGTEECPPGFSDKHVVGTDGAELDCGGTCSCTVNRAACQGAVHHFSDTTCTLNETIIPANGLCGGPNTQGGDFDSYKVIATSATTCSGTGNGTASNVRLKNPRTVCCR